MLEYKSVSMKQSIEADETGLFSGWGAVVNVEDDGGDTILPGAMRKSLERRTPKIYLGHHTSVGKFKVAEERSKGLWVEGQPDTSTAGMDARIGLKSGALDSLSIGYVTVSAKETGRFKRDLIEIDVYHVGIVPFGMNDAASVVDVKSLDADGLEAITNIRDLERALRDVGLSRKAAEIVCSPGFIADLAARGDPGDETAQALASVQGLIAALQGAR